MPQSIKPPAACKPHELENFKAMLLASEQEGEDGLDQRIEQAELLAFYYDNSKKLAAIAALKHTNEGYLKGVFKKAGIPERNAVYPLEFGWFHILGEYRRKGILVSLLQRLLERSGGQAIFATVRLSDQEMATGLTQQGFVLSGEPYSRRDHRYKYQVYLREAAAGQDKDLVAS
ncbi:MAG: hypothetical protein CVU44_07425 [Chloroflexi bacterium HGW-Chloroflexi-6]|nr:MAG: hypothetical protein CVU44_07425 [Chloroflexi bacterium HGW-Chloroflexi-6]